MLAALDDLLKGGPDGRVLIIASLGPCRAVLLKEDGGLGFGKIDARVFGITGGQVAVMEKSESGQVPPCSFVVRSYSPYRWPLVAKTYFTSKRLQSE